MSRKKLFVLRDVYGSLRSPGAAKRPYIPGRLNGGRFFHLCRVFSIIHCLSIFFVQMVPRKNVIYCYYTIHNHDFYFQKSNTSMARCARPGPRSGPILPAILICLFYIHVLGMFLRSQIHSLSTFPIKY